MKKNLVIVSFLILVISCSYFPKYVKVEGSVLKITNFKCSYWNGIVNGDFDSLDKEFFKALKGKNGNYSIELIYNKSKDRFGNKTNRNYSLGTIDASQLSSYAEYSYWANDTGGTREIIFKFFKK